MTPWGGEEETTNSTNFDLEQIVANGELIALALTGPETYYDYRGRQLGTEYMLCQRFTNKIGVSLRVEVCRDSAEMLRRLTDGEADLVLSVMTGNRNNWRGVLERTNPNLPRH